MKKAKILVILLICLFCIKDAYSTHRPIALGGNQVFCYGDSSRLFVADSASFLSYCGSNCQPTAYQWYLNGNLLSGATRRYYNTITPGLYQCAVSMPFCYGGGGPFNDTITSGMSDTLRVFGALTATFTLLSDTNLCHGDTLKIRVQKSALGGYCASDDLYGLCYINSSGCSSLVDTLYGLNADSIHYSNGYAAACSTFSHQKTVYARVSYGYGYCGIGSEITCATSNTFHINYLDSLRHIIPTGSNPLCLGDSLQLAIDAYSISGQTYQWKRNNNAVNGATGIGYEARLNGSYFATIHYAQGCSINTDTLSATVYPPTAVTLTASSIHLLTSTLTGTPGGGTYSGPGVSGNVFTVPDPVNGGTWTVYYTYSDFNGCSFRDSTSITYVAPLGIPHVVSAAISIRPNPAKDMIEVTITDGGTSSYHLIITDAIGRTVYTSQMKEQRNQIDMSGFNKGVYVFRINDGNGDQKLTQNIVLQ